MGSGESTQNMQKRVDKAESLSSSQKEELSRLVAELEKLRGQVIRLTKENGILNGKLESVTNNREQLFREKTASKKELDDYTAKITTLSSKVRGLQTELDGCKATRSGLTDENERLDGELQEQRKLVIQLKSATSRSEQEISDLKTRKQEQEKKIQELQAELEEYKTKYTNLMAEQSASATDVKHLSAAKSGLEEENRKKEGEMKKLSEAKEKLSEERAKLQQEVAGLESLKASLDVTIEDSKKQANELKQKIEEMQKKFDKKEQEMREMHADDMKMQREQNQKLMEQQSQDHRFQTESMTNQSKMFLSFMSEQQNEDRKTTQLALQSLLQSNDRSQTFMSKMLEGAGKHSALPEIEQGSHKALGDSADERKNEEY